MSSKSSKQTTSRATERKSSPARDETEVDTSVSNSSEEKTSTTRPQRADKDKPCFAFFKKDSEGGSSCLKGDRCKFSHKPEAYMDFKGLKKCPNCDNLCKKESKQCRQCVQGWLETREEDDLRRRAEEKARYQEAKQKDWKRKQELRRQKWEELQEEIAQRPERQCRGGRQRDDEGNVVGKGFQCHEMTKFDLCKSCYDTQQSHRAPSYRPRIMVTMKSSDRRRPKNSQPEPEPDEVDNSEEVDAEGDQEIEIEEEEDQE